MKKVAWIGAGVMGRPMAGHLQAKGFDVSVYARKPEVLETMKTQYGIEKCYSTIQEAVADAEVVFVMVGYPKDVEEVILGENGVFANVKPGTYVVDMTTSSPSLAVRLYEEGKKKGLHVMDAPVSGGDSGAKAGTLSIWWAATRPTSRLSCPCSRPSARASTTWVPLAAASTPRRQPDLCGRRHRRLHRGHHLRPEGGPGPREDAAGHQRRRCRQLADQQHGPQSPPRRPRPGFFIKHFVKDMRIVKEEAAAKGVDLEMLDSVLGLYEKMMERGYENDGTQALIKYYQN